MKNFALLSVTDKTGIVDFAKKLISLGYKIISTGGTAKVLEKEGVNYLPISEYTKQMEIMDGRVKTLHPMIHGGILARRDVDEDLKSLADLGAGLIDVVAVNLYPFVKIFNEFRAIKHESEMIEYIDIGGPTLLRAAAKNFQHVYSIIDHNDYDLVLNSLEKKLDNLNLRRKLAGKVFAHISAYDLYVAKYLSRDIEAKSANSLSEYEGIVHRRIQDLRYGENPSQKAGWYAPLDAVERSSLIQLQGKELSFNNLNDIYAAAELSIDLGLAFPEINSVTIIKHANPCGVSIGKDALDIFKKAVSCDPVSAFGGIVAFSANVNVAIANEIVSSFYEVILAPGFDEDAISVLGEKKNLRLIKVDYEKLKTERSNNLQIKTVLEGSLVQTHDTGGVNLVELKWVSGLEFVSENQKNDAILSFVVSKHVKSNAIVIALDGLVVGIGAGQMNRVDSSRFAIARAASNGHTVVNSVVASDAFLPFSDNIDVFSEAGIKLVIQPGGSIRDAEVIEAAKTKGINMVFTNERHFRH